MSSLFTKIIAGEIPCHKVAETDDFLAFLDIAPNTMGHTLCIPKLETDYIFDIEDASLQHFILFAKKVALAIQQVVPCKRIGMSVIGLEVPHAHIHLIPLVAGIQDMTFLSKTETSSEALATLAEQISDAYAHHA